MGNFKSFKKVVLLVMLVVFTISFGTSVVTPARAATSSTTVTELNNSEPWDSITVEGVNIVSSNPAAVWLENKSTSGELKLAENATISALSIDAKSGGTSVYGMYMKDFSAADYTITLSNGSAIISAINKKTDYGANATGLYADNLTVKTGGKSLTVKTARAEFGLVRGVYVTNFATLDLLDDPEDPVTFGTLKIGGDGEDLITSNNDYHVYGLDVSATVNAGAIDIKNVRSQLRAYGVNLVGNGSIKTNGMDVTIKGIQTYSNAGHNAVGFFVDGDATLDLCDPKDTTREFVGNLTIGADGEGNGIIATNQSSAYGLWVAGNATVNAGKINIKNVSATSKAYGAYLESDGPEGASVKTNGKDVTITGIQAAPGYDEAYQAYGIYLEKGAELDLAFPKAGSGKYGILKIGADGDGNGIKSTEEEAYGLYAEGEATTVNAGEIVIKNVSGLSNPDHLVSGVRLKNFSTIQTNGNNLTVTSITDNATETADAAIGVDVEDSAELDLSDDTVDPTKFGTLTIGADGEGKGIKSTAGAAYGLNVESSATVNAGEIVIKNVSGASRTSGVYLDDENTSVTTNGEAVTVDGIQTSNGEAFGLLAEDGATANTGAIDIKNVSGTDKTRGVCLGGENTSLKTNGKDVTVKAISSSGEVGGILLVDDAKLDLSKVEGDTKTYGKLTIGADGDDGVIKSTADQAYGLDVQTGATVTAGEIVIKNVSGANRGSGLNVNGEKASVTTNDKDITITGVQVYGMAAGVSMVEGASLDFGKGKLTIDGVKSTGPGKAGVALAGGYLVSGATEAHQGSVSIRNIEGPGAFAIVVLGAKIEKPEEPANSMLTLGYKDDGVTPEGGTYQIEGDVAATKASSSATAELKMALQNDASYLYGNLLSTYNEMSMLEKGKITLDLLNGATWYPVSVADTTFVNDATVRMTEGTKNDSSAGVINIAYSDFQKDGDGKYVRDENDALIPVYDAEKTAFRTVQVSNLEITCGLLKIQSNVNSDATTKADKLVAAALTLGDEAELKIKVMYDPAFNDAKSVTDKEIVVFTGNQTLSSDLLKVTGVATGDYTPTFDFSGDSKSIILTGFTYSGEPPAPVVEPTTTSEALGSVGAAAKTSSFTMTANETLDAAWGTFVERDGAGKTLTLKGDGTNKNTVDGDDNEGLVVNGEGHSVTVDSITVKNMNNPFTVTKGTLTLKDVTIGDDVTGNITNDGLVTLAGGKSDSDRVKFGVALQNSKGATDTSVGIVDFGDGAAAFISNDKAITQNAINVKTSADVTNTGKLTAKTLINAGTLSAAIDDLSVDTTFTNNGTLETSGELNKLSTLTNSGTVKIASGKTLKVTADKNLGGTLDMNNTEDVQKKPVYTTIDMQETEGEASYSTLTVVTLKGNGDLKINANVNEAVKSADNIKFSSVVGTPVINLASINLAQGFTTHAIEGTPKTETNWLIVLDGTGATLKVNGDTGSITTQLGNYSYKFTTTGSTAGKLTVTETYNPITLTDYIKGDEKTKDLTSYSFESDETLAAAVTTGVTKTNYTIGMNGKDLTGSNNNGIRISNEKTLSIDGKNTAANNGTISGFDTALTVDEGGTLKISNVNFSDNNTAISNAGTLNMSGTNSFDSKITGNGTATNAGTVNIAANNLDIALQNDGTLNLGAGTLGLGKNISGTGATVISGVVKSNAEIANTITLDGAGNSLEIAAGNVGGAVTNNKGTLTLDGGKLEQQVSAATEGEMGTIDLQAATEIAAQINDQIIKATKGYSTVADASYITSDILTFDGGGFDFQDGKVTEYTVDGLNLLGNGYLKLDVDLANEEMDRFNTNAVSGSEGAKLHVTALTLLSDAKKNKTNIVFATSDSLKGDVVSDVTHVASDMWKYLVAYDKETGEFAFTKGGRNEPDKPEVSETTKSVADTANAINLAWLETTNTLQKRLGDLRGGEASNTGWARFQRSNDDHNGARKLNVSGNLYQLGYDVALKNNTAARGYFGLSVEHFDGSQSYKIGGGDVKSTSLSAYYTKIYDSGHYFDFIFRYGRYESDTTSYDAGLSTKLDYGMNGVTLSGEYGYRANIGKDGFYFEPQAEVIYGYLAGAKKRSSRGILADIDSTNHFVTRLGVALGKKVKNFNYYLRGSYYHDFAGTTNILYGDASYKQDSARNWWELSLGGGWNMTDASYFYAELTKHFKDVSNSINFNLGFRFTL